MEVKMIFVFGQQMIQIDGVNVNIEIVIQIVGQCIFCG